MEVSTGSSLLQTFVWNIRWFDVWSSLIFNQSQTEKLAALQLSRHCES